MVAYNFNSIIGQRVSFAPATDTITFSVPANQVSFAVSGVTLAVTTSAGTVFLDATPQYDATTIGLFGPSNMVFSNGIVAAGDLTGGDAADEDANLIDFVATPTLVSALNANNQIYGLGGDDTINLAGSSGSQIVFGGLDGDAITVGEGNNTLYGGEGIVDTADGGDSFIVGSGSNSIYGNAGADGVTFSSVTASGQTLRYWGGAGADSLTADGAAGRFEINAGTDGDTITLTNGTASNLIHGGAGTDTINLTGSTGNNTVYGGTGPVDATDVADAITLGGGSDLLYANAGADAVTATPNAGQTTRAYLGAGGDTLTAGASGGNFVVYGGTDNDIVDLSSNTGYAIIYGGSSIADSTDGSDTITSGAAAGVLIYANSGNDVVTVQPGAGQSATVYGGSGNDTIHAVPGSNSAVLTLYGNTGNDQFALDFSAGSATANLMDYGTGENDLELTLSGGASAANLTVTRSANQTVLRNGGNEQIVLHGFTGNFDDTSYVDSNGSLLATNFNGAAATLTGTLGNDQLIAGSNGDTLVADTGNDLLTGGSGADRFSFLTANFDANDTVTGGGGLDSISIATPGTAIVDSQFSNKSQVEILRLDGGDFSTAGITLGTAANAAGIYAIDASTASAVTADLTATSRAMLYIGGTTTDSVTGGIHNDVLDGRAGDDTLQGGAGADILKGGDGADTFIYHSNALYGSDVLRDFDFGESGTQVDFLQFASDGSGFNLGNRDAIVDGAILNSVTAAGASGTEIIILNTTGVATNAISSVLDIVNANVATDRGALNLLFDITRDQVVMYYDTNGGTAGGHTLLIAFENMTDSADLSAVDFNDFAFV